MTDYLTVKLKTPESQFFRFRLPKPVSLEELASTIRIYCPQEGTIKYIDDDGDLVTMDSETELNEAVSLLRPSAMLRLEFVANQPPVQRANDDVNDVSDNRSLTEPKAVLTAANSAPVSDHSAAQTTLPPPQAEALNEGRPLPTTHGLPSGWEMKIDQKSRVYFANHNEQTTTWLHPITKERVLLSPTYDDALPKKEENKNEKEKVEENEKDSVPTLAQIEAMTQRVVEVALRENMKSMEEMVRQVLPQVLADYHSDKTTVSANADDIVIPVTMSVQEAQRMQATNGYVSIGLPQLMQPNQTYESQYPQTVEQVEQPLREESVGHHHLPQYPIEERVYDPNAVVLHTHVICDVTNQNPIVGVRYHKVGEDYDLCDSAFAKLSEEEKAKYEIIERPGMNPVPYTTVGTTAISSSIDNDEIGLKDEHVTEQYVEFATAMPELNLTLKSEVRQGTEESTPVASPTPVDTTAVVVDMPVPPSRPQVAFIADITLPDDVMVPASGELNKTWSIKNVGESKWPEGSVLTLYQGQLSDPSTVFPVPAADVGEVIEVTAALRTHGLSGNQVGIYRLTDGNGTNFDGDLLWSKLDVVNVPESSSLLVNGVNTGNDIESDFGTIDDTDDGSEEEFIVVHPTTEDPLSQAINVLLADSANAPTSDSDSNAHAPASSGSTTEDLSDAYAPMMSGTLSDSSASQASDLSPSTEHHSESMMVIRNDEADSVSTVTADQAPVATAPNAPYVSAPTVALQDVIIPPIPVSPVISSITGYPSVAPATVPPPPVNYTVEMGQLISMGFGNRTVNDEVLKKHKGNVELCVSDLIAMQEAQMRY